MATNDIVLLAIVGVFFLGGLISGFVKSSSKIFALAGGGLLSFYLGGVVSKLLIDKIEAVQNWVNSNSFGSSLILIASYVGVFLVTFLVLKLILKFFSNLLSGGGIGKFFDKLLGAVAGVAIGFIVADLYVWVLYGLGSANTDIANWVIEDAKLGLDGFQSLTKSIMELNLNAIGATFPGI